MTFVAALLFGLTAVTSPEAPEPAAPQIHVISIGVGRATYAQFGHTALRVKFPDGRDLAYDFGGVDLEQPQFWLRLVQGKIQAYLDKKTYTELLLAYSGEDRTIRGRALQLPPRAAHAAVRELERIFASPERHYVYDHALDNCTTRVAALLDSVTDGALQSEGSGPSPWGSRRQMIEARVRNRPWLYVFMDLMANQTGDVPLTEWQAASIPPGLDRLIDRVTLDGRPLVAARYLDYRSINFDDPPLYDWPWTRLYILLALPLLGLMFWKLRLGAFAWGVIAAAIGTTALLLWALSGYHWYPYNLNILVFPPTHLAVAALSLRASTWARAQPALRAYAAVHGVLLVGLLITWASGLTAQNIGPMLAAALPLSAAMAYRLIALPSNVRDPIASSEPLPRASPGSSHP